MKRYAVILLFIFCVGFLAVNVRAQETLFEKFQDYVTVYNQNVDILPENVKGMLGNERINIHVRMDDGSEKVIGIVTKDAVITETEEGGLGDPTINAHISEEKINSLVSSKDPAADLMEMIKTGEMSLEGVGFFNWLRIAFLNFLMWLFSLFGG